MQHVTLSIDIPAIQKSDNMSAQERGKYKFIHSWSTSPRFLTSGLYRLIVFVMNIAVETASRTWHVHAELQRSKLSLCDLLSV